jgi:predicted transcriptional regulator
MPMPLSPNSRPRNILGSLERGVMEYLWTAVPSHPDGRTGRQVHDAVGVERGVGYTTVVTVLDRMVGKGLVTRVRDGRVWRYAAASTREALTSHLLHHTLDELAGAERRSALLHFLGNSTPEEVAQLRSVLAEIEAREEDEQTPPAQPR